MSFSLSFSQKKLRVFVSVAQKNESKVKLITFFYPPVTFCDQSFQKKYEKVFPINIKSFDHRNLKRKLMSEQLCDHYDDRQYK